MTQEKAKKPSKKTVKAPDIDGLVSEWEVLSSNDGATITEIFEFAKTLYGSKKALSKDEGNAETIKGIFDECKDIISRRVEGIANSADLKTAWEGASMVKKSYDKDSYEALLKKFAGRFKEIRLGEGDTEEVRNLLDDLYEVIKKEGNIDSVYMRTDPDRFFDGLGAIKKDDESANIVYMIASKRISENHDSSVIWLKSLFKYIEGSKSNPKKKNRGEVLERRSLGLIDLVKLNPALESSIISDSSISLPESWRSKLITPLGERTAEVSEQQTALGEETSDEYYKRKLDNVFDEVKRAVEDAVVDLLEKSRKAFSGEEAEMLKEILNRLDEQQYRVTNNISRLFQDVPGDIRAINLKLGVAAIIPMLQKNIEELKGYYGRLTGEIAPLKAKIDTLSDRDEVSIRIQTLEGLFSAMSSQLINLSLFEAKWRNDPDEDKRTIAKTLSGLFDSMKEQGIYAIGIIGKGVKYDPSLHEDLNRQASKGDPVTVELLGWQFKEGKRRSVIQKAKVTMAEKGMEDGKK